MSAIGKLFSSPKVKEIMQPTPPPSVNAEPAANNDKLRRVGRASVLINTSGQGLLGNANTGRRQLLS